MERSKINFDKRQGSSVAIDADEKRGFEVGAMWASWWPSFRSLQKIGDAPASKSSMAAIRGRRQDKFWIGVLGSSWQTDLTPAYERGFIHGVQHTWRQFLYM